MARQTGIRVRHGRRCRSREGGNCNCTPSYEAAVWSARDGKKIRERFDTMSAAVGWRADAIGDVRRGKRRAPTAETLNEAADALLAGMRDGTIRNRNRRPFKPSVIRTYEQSLQNHVRPAFGPRKLAGLTRSDVQDLADRLLAQGLDPSTVRNAVIPLRVVCRLAIRRGVLAVNPTHDLDLPAVEGRRERVASPEEARQLLEALPAADRPLWAVALYAGLRAGELQALQTEDVEDGLIHVRRSWDRKEGFVGTKSTAGERTIPVCEHLAEHLPETGEGFYFGTETQPFDYWRTVERAYKAWRDAGLNRITLHECRHSYSTFLDAAGVSETRADRYMGHARHDVQSRYRHPSQYAEDAARLDAYLSGATTGKVVPLPTGAQIGAHEAQAV